MRNIALCAVVLALSCIALGQTEYKVLWSFGGTSADAATPLSNLVFDKAGNLYGTTHSGGARNLGTVFELSPNSDGSWTEAVLYSFCMDKVGIQCLDGQVPWAGLLLDPQGNLYGTTRNGGAEPCEFDLEGCGTVFELSPPAVPGQPWTETVLYNFCSNEVHSQCLDGHHPVSQLIFDGLGNLYGTTSAGGTGHMVKTLNDGVVFELSPGTSGWTEKVLYNFCSLGQGNFCPDGAFPQAGVTFDKSGNLYGTTGSVGAPRSSGGGTVYKLSNINNNEWTETVLYAFAPPPYARGAGPIGTVAFDSLGSLYSTVEGSAQYGFGGVFRLNSKGSEETLSFNGNDGATPVAGVVVDSKRNALYGTTSTGGGFGTIFKIVAPAELTVLYNLCSQANCIDGSVPFGGLIEDRSGNLYGTTKLGGTNNKGVVFEIVQSPAPQSTHSTGWHAIVPSK